jgi:CubicO group peptidase (beta-lactamase class C family)
MRNRLLSLSFALLAAPSVQAAPPSAAEVSQHAQAMLERVYPDASAPGAAVLVARDDDVLFRGARGAASVELGAPLDAGQVFRLASVTKQFAAAGLLRLVDEGKVSLDDPLSRFLPDYPNGKAVTVRQLLNHTSGIKSYTGIQGHMLAGIRQDLDTKALVEVFKDQPSDFKPGEGYAYNNSGYVLVGAVIEAASGKPWHQYLEEAFFKPLGMDDTHWGDDAAVIPRQVRGYSSEGEQLRSPRVLSMTQPHAAGALVSSVDDLLTWNRALHEGRLLKPASYRAMTTPEGKAADDGYGYGISVGKIRGEKALQHGGGIFGFSTFLLYLPESGVTVAMLQNSDSRPGMEVGELSRMLAAHAVGKPYPQATPLKVDPAMLKSVEGVYRIDKDAARVLRVVDGKLTSQRTGSDPFALIPIGADEFLFKDSLTHMTIERDASGKAVAMLFQPNGDGEPQRVARTDEPLPAERARVQLDAPALERVSGTYAGAPGTMRVFVDEDKLMGQLTGQPAIELLAESADVFYPTVVAATLEFSPAAGPAQMLTLKQGGGEMVFTRQAD